jgi:hypothetical protein
MKRREFVTLLGGTGAAWPLAARAQQPAMPLIGFLSSLSASVTSKRISSFGEELSETGYTVGRDVTVEARLAEGQDDLIEAWLVVIRAERAFQSAPLWYRAHRSRQNRLEDFCPVRNKPAS